MTRSPAWRAANQRHLAAELDRLKRLLVPTDDPPPPPDDGKSSALREVQDGFGLSDFERDVLLLCAGVELDTAFARACAKAHGDPERTWASFGLALSKLDHVHWSALTPAAPLRAHRLVSLSQPESPTVSTLRITERVLHALVGLDYLDPAIEPFTFSPKPSGRELPPRSRQAAGALASQWASPAAHVGVQGRHRADLLAIASAAADESGRRPVFLDAAALPPDLHDLAVVCERENALCPTAWVLDLTEADEPAQRVAARFAARLTSPVALLACRPPPGPALPHLVVPPSTVDERIQVWRTVTDEESATALAAQFDLDSDTVDAVLSETAAAGEITAEGLWRGCRQHARPGIDAVAEHVPARAGWDDIVLPPHQLARLRDMVAHLRHRHLVLHEWGFGDLSGRGLGTAALFAGPSGTGKTLAAEVVAGELDLDLYRVDISRVVSKYIGETEKNLSRVFDAADAGGAVLLFDEADALFGKRGEVKDGRDRYANMEVGYLLQRIEAYRGLAILTTNLKDSLDQAFQRRLRFVVDFPFPDSRARTALWRTAFPAGTPTESLDADLLAQLSLSGASIRNTALFAAFLAADRGEPVRMTHVLEAARIEYAKLERQMTGAEVAGWTT